MIEISRRDNISMTFGFSHQRRVTHIAPVGLGWGWGWVGVGVGLRLGLGWGWGWVHFLRIYGNTLVLYKKGYPVSGQRGNIRYRCVTPSVPTAVVVQTSYLASISRSVDPFGIRGPFGWLLQMPLIRSFTSSMSTMLCSKKQPPGGEEEGEKT